MPIHLVLGGARSGKTAFAEQTALKQGGSLHYIATAQPRADAEFQARIARHQSTRSKQFHTHETPLLLAAQLQTLNSPEHTVVVDCLTLWVTNCLLAECWDAERKALLDLLPQLHCYCLLVSNEVGLGVVPMGELSRQFVDASGWLHQDIAAVAENVTQVIAGLPQRLKPVLNG
jgi:adenosylcobinamide kinase/adenosylcobinamide-phosphate guanylyltransferase